MCLNAEPSVPEKRLDAKTNEFRDAGSEFQVKPCSAFSWLLNIGSSILDIFC